MKNKVWLCGITNEGNEQNLKELIDPIKDYFDGLVWTFHYPKDEGADYLESAKGDGKIIYTDWLGRYDFPRNHYLFSNVIREGDWFFNIDSEERLSPEFMQNWSSHKEIFENNGIDGLYYEGKFMAFKLNEWMYWKNSIHEMLSGCNRAIDLHGHEVFDSTPIRTNLRLEKRREFDFVKQALRYYLTKGSIHVQLGCEDNPELIKKRHEIRMNFRLYLLSKEININNVDDVIDFICSDNLDSFTKNCINSEKYINDAYRYYKLGLEDFSQDFDFSNLVLV
ncbi:hypothetical protein N9973_00350 [bacterium]|nr:hypothetical protein [bacterium]